MSDKRTAEQGLKLTDIPLWRLLVLLHDQEQAGGTNNSAARAIARVIQQKLASEAKGGAS